MLDAENFREMYDHGMSGEDKEWKSWLFKTIDNELIDPKEVEAAKRTLSTLAYLQEYEAEWVTMGANVFKMEWFKTSPAPSGKEYSTYIAVDPAGFEDVAKLGIDDKKKKHLDYTAIAIVRVYDDGKWWVQAIHHGRWDVRETATRILLAVRTHKPVCVGIEKGSLRRAIMPYLTDLMRKNNVYAHIEDIATSGSSKVDRIVYALQGLMEHGRITFNVDEDWAEMKREMMGFPSQRVHDDLLDAAAMIAHLAQVIYGNKNTQEEDWEPVDLVAGI
jgi:predicted phage terminase large subunit-like protein